MKVTFVCLALLFSSNAMGQVSPWVHHSDYTAHLWPSFVTLWKTTPAIDFTSYTIVRSEHSPGELDFTNCTVSKDEALTAALVFMRGTYEIKKYNISMDIVNLIPYKNGCILYGYCKEKNQWDLLNIGSRSVIQHKPYIRYDVVKK